jgi:hypothetical protein
MSLVNTSFVVATKSKKDGLNQRFLRAHLTPPHSAGLKPAVTPICNRQRANRPVVVELFTPRGLQIRDTADYKSALRRIRPRMDEC